MNRRNLITGLGALLCAPAIVRASSLMPVKALKDPMWSTSDLYFKATERMGPMFFDERLLQGACIDDDGRLMLPMMIHHT